MGDARFEKEWQAWQDAVAHDQATTFLASEPLARLVDLLASNSAATDPVARNVVATAIANRLRERGGDERPLRDIFSMIAQTERRAQLSRELAAASRALRERMDLSEILPDAER